MRMTHGSQPDMRSMHVRNAQEIMAMYRDRSAA
jgi:hypothetical protein